jgi:hypothetical protein
MSRSPDSRERCPTIHHQRPRLPTCPLIPTASQRNHRLTSRVAPSETRTRPCKRECRGLASQRTFVRPVRESRLRAASLLGFHLPRKLLRAVVARRLGRHPDCRAGAAEAIPSGNRKRGRPRSAADPPLLGGRALERRPALGERLEGPSATSGGRDDSRWRYTGPKRRTRVARTAFFRHERVAAAQAVVSASAEAVQPLCVVHRLRTPLIARAPCPRQD